jgi:hypothetical protein
MSETWPMDLSSTTAPTLQPFTTAPTSSHRAHQTNHITPTTSPTSSHHHVTARHIASMASTSLVKTQIRASSRGLVKAPTCRYVRISALPCRPSSKACHQNSYNNESGVEIDAPRACVAALLSLTVSMSVISPLICASTAFAAEGTHKSLLFNVFCL